jgi:hypothetical protein
VLSLRFAYRNSAFPQLKGISEKGSIPGSSTREEAGQDVFRPGLLPFWAHLNHGRLRTVGARHQDRAGPRRARGSSGQRAQGGRPRKVPPPLRRGISGTRASRQPTSPRCSVSRAPPCTATSPTPRRSPPERLQRGDGPIAHPRVPPTRPRRSRKVVRSARDCVSAAAGSPGAAAPSASATQPHHTVRSPESLTTSSL